MSKSTYLAAAGFFLALHFASAQPPGKESSPENAPVVVSISGPVLFSEYCSVCHGWDGKGDGPMAKSLRVRPPDLTRLAIRNRGVFSIDRMERVISGEEQLPRGHGTRQMPIWGPIFSQVDRDRDFGPVRLNNLAKYIEGLQRR